MKIRRHYRSLSENPIWLRAACFATDRCLAASTIYGDIACFAVLASHKTARSRADDGVLRQTPSWRGIVNQSSLIALVCLLLVSGCAVTSDPLPSWNDGPNKRAILDFVASVTTPGSANFVPQEERVATFDNDGTLWSEQPIYFQLVFALDRLKELAPQHPEWRRKQPFKAALEGDLKTVFSSGHHGLLELVMETHSGMTTEEFTQVVKDWLATAKHPRFNQPYNQCVYQPMLEILVHLRANGFKTFIVSGGGIEFMRPWTEQVYGIPPEQVVGSSIKTKFEMRDGKPVLVRLPEINFLDDKADKPVGINRHIGRRPIAAFGNSDGDLQMLQWTAAGDGPNLMVYIHHTDAEREWAYDRESHIGRLDKGLDQANTKGWMIVDMKKDWKVIYPFQMR